MLSLSLYLTEARCQDTFSIVAVDPATGEVGSAGASCIANSAIISDVHPGVGAIHTQSYWISGNQVYARGLMNSGHSPQQIMDSVVLHDVNGDSTLRQYGVVDLVNGGRSAAFTGSNCMDYKSHITGPGYAIQGNILLGQQILDSMEARYLNTPGPLCDKLMAALQGANVPGADTRCMVYGKPALSAFIRVARPADTVFGYFLDIKVGNTASNVNPIDSLQGLFDAFKIANSISGPRNGNLSFSGTGNGNGLILRFPSQEYSGEEVTILVSDLNGRIVASQTSYVQKYIEVPTAYPLSGIFIIEVKGKQGLRAWSKCLIP